MIFDPVNGHNLLTLGSYWLTTTAIGLTFAVTRDITTT